jgi:hypothetical protein
VDVDVLVGVATTTTAEAYVKGFRFLVEEIIGIVAGNSVRDSVKYLITV